MIITSSQLNFLGQIFNDVAVLVTTPGSMSQLEVGGLLWSLGVQVLDSY